MINFSATDKKEKLKAGTSHMFGSPDVPEYFEWPTSTTRYGDEIDMAFLCQINCKDIKSDFLPTSGILYFFYNVAEQPATPNIKDAAKIFWFDEEEDKLSTFRLVGSDGEDLLPPSIVLDVTDGEYNVSISTEYDDISENQSEEDEFEEEFEDLDDFEEFEFDEEKSDDEMVVLASFKEYEDENVSFTFEKGSELCFLIKRSSLEDLDFSDIRVLIV